MSEEFLPPIVAVLTANIKEFQAKMGQAAETSKVETAAMSGHAKKFGAISKVAMLGAAVAVFEIGKSVFETTEKFESAHVRLDQIVKNTGANVREFNEGLEAQHSKYANLAIDATQYESALAVLVAATGNAKVAERDMAEAADLAAAKHMDLESAAKLVGKVATGNVAVLKRYGIDLGIAGGGVQAVKKAHDQLTAAMQVQQHILSQIHTGKLKGAAADYALQQSTDHVRAAQEKLNAAQSAGDKGISALAKKFGGSASAQTDTLGGKMAVLRAKIHNVEIEIGEKLNGAINHMGQWLNGKSGSPAVVALGNAWDGVKEAMPGIESAFVTAVDGMADAVDTLTDKLATAVDLITNELAGAEQGLTNWILSPLTTHGAKDLAATKTSDADAQRMADAYDKAHGLPPGTTWYREQHGTKANESTPQTLGGSGTKGRKSTTPTGPSAPAKPKAPTPPTSRPRIKTKAVGGTDEYPVAGALAVLHGKETVLPHSDPGRARLLYKQSGLAGPDSGGGVTIHGGLHLTVVTPDPAKSGESIKRALTDATFLRERT